MFNLKIQSLALPISPAKNHLTVALISDTHSTAKKPDLSPSLIQKLEEQPPDVILHAGDICQDETLLELRKICPVYAVCGNRDYAIQDNLPDVIRLDIFGQRVILTHGHGPIFHYLQDKLLYYRDGFRFERYHRYLISIDPQADLYLFGHTHIPFHIRVNGKRFINPGAASLVNKHDRYPAFTVLHFIKSQDVDVQFVYL